MPSGRKKTDHYVDQLQVPVSQGRRGGASSREMAFCPNKLGSSPGMDFTFTVKDCCHSNLLSVKLSLKNLS